MRPFWKSMLPAMDVVLAPLVYPAGFLLRAIRKEGVSVMPRCKRALLQVGVFPVRNHYYEPLFDSRELIRPLETNRILPGIEWNLEEQLSLLEMFHFNDEFKNVPLTQIDELTYYVNNGTFNSGDADFLYNLIRLKKPARIFEIGSGNSTLMAIRAVRQNKIDDPGYQCRHLCIEPYEMPWLEKADVTVLRERVENQKIELFSKLEKNDLLFIDSSHVIRPQGDVLFEYLELLPTLKSGVIVHIHDIFTPRDYPKQWVVDEVRLWNEQYLLEAFLTENRNWKIIGALNYLYHNHFDSLSRKCPLLTRDGQPASFYIQKTA